MDREDALRLLQGWCDSAARVRCEWGGRRVAFSVILRVVEVTTTRLVFGANELTAKLSVNLPAECFFGVAEMPTATERRQFVRGLVIAFPHGDDGDPECLAIAEIRE